VPLEVNIALTLHLEPSLVASSGRCQEPVLRRAKCPSGRKDFGAAMPEMDAMGC